MCSSRFHSTLIPESAVPRWPRMLCAYTVPGHLACLGTWAGEHTCAVMCYTGYSSQIRATVSSRVVPATPSIPCCTVTALRVRARRHALRCGISHVARGCQSVEVGQLARYCGDRHRHLHYCDCPACFAAELAPPTGLTPTCQPASLPMHAMPPRWTHFVPCPGRTQFQHSLA